MKNYIANKIYSYYTSKLLLLIIFLLTILSSPIFYYLGLKFSYILLALSIPILILFIKRGYINLHFLIIGIFYLSLGLFSYLYSGSKDSLYFAVNIFIGIYFLSFINRMEFLSLINILTLFVFVALLCSIAGYISVLNGLLPLFSINTPHVNELNFYPFSFSLLYPTPAGWTARPTFIFDEPGALSLYVCVVVAIRQIAGMKASTSFLMLTLGLITFSLAHVLYTAAFFILNFRDIKYRHYYLILFVTLILLSIFFSQQFSFLNNVFMVIERLFFGNNMPSLFSGGNRAYYLGLSYDQFIEANWYNILFGWDSPSGCCNPIHPFIVGGLVGSLYYYSFIIFLFLIPVFRPTRSNLIIIFLAALFLQRPEVGMPGVATLSCVVFYALLFFYSNRIKGIK
jgi:hypothetical protein